MLKTKPRAFMFYMDTNVSHEYEYVSSVSPQYNMSENIFFEPFNLYVYLIQDRDSGKYNVYVAEEDLVRWCPDLWFVVKHFQVIKLDIANFFFPQYAFNEETYGF